MGVVAALSAEARTLGPTTRRAGGMAMLRDGSLVAMSGMGAAAAASGARALIDAGAGALVSWGMAGGLDPALSAGVVCLPSGVVAGDGTVFATDDHWREGVVAAVGARVEIVGGALLTHDSPIGSVSSKTAAFAACGACAIDMESAAVAAVAASCSLPFIAVRAIVDTAEDELPAAVLAASIGAQVNVLRLLRELAHSPREISPLLKLARRYRAAIRALTAVARTGVSLPVTNAAAATAAAAAAARSV